MATKKFKCSVCGYVHEGDSAPAQCPKCNQPGEKFTEETEAAPAAPKKKGIDTSSNVYTIIYSCIVVVIVAFLLAFVSSALKDRSDANVRIDTMNQILSSLNISVDKSEVEAKYTEVVKEELQEKQVFKCEVNGETKYVFRLDGKGLWGAIWGYLAVNDDLDTVYGVYFGHASETAGLGAEITNPKWKAQFVGKKLRNADTGAIALSVVKAGKSKDGVQDYNKCDGVTGATLTSNGVDAMINDCLAGYAQYLEK